MISLDQYAYSLWILDSWFIVDGLPMAEFSELSDLPRDFVLLKGLVDG